ncbi:MAG: Zn-dependent exopeptidase M28 [Gemmatimonadetes bacterium]|nr:Zn-dependent exopeptidase M28 [Gemmatimonadota bacterium]
MLKLFRIVGVAITLAAPSLAAQSLVLPPAPEDDPVRTLVGRLDLERYKATVKGLTQFGDRRQGTKRNRDALDWIEAQLKSYGCTNTERVTYTYPAAAAAGRGGGGAAAGGGRGAGGAAAGAAGGGGRGAGGAGGGRGAAAGPPADTLPLGGVQAGGWRFRGTRGRTGVNNDSLQQADLRLRALNAEPATNGERQSVFCTKVGSTRPDEMYILGAHMDGHGWGEAANDDGSGTALVMEIARVLSSPEVQTERSIRFALWNNEETGLNGAQAYVDQRAALQGIENPAGSGRYPEPKWVAMIQHDMMMFDHGMPGPDGKPAKEQRREADVNIEFAITSKFADPAMKLAFLFRQANERYATDYPAAVGPYMTNTDSRPFQDLIPAISLRENERGMHTGSGWNPHWHQVTDVFSTFSDKDFRLGLNATQTTLGAVGVLAGATIRK